MPASDDEAIERIVAAAKRNIDGHGHATIAEVARDLGITRRTVYRYFPTQDDLVMGAAISATAGFIDRLTEHVRELNAPDQIIVETIAYTYEQLPRHKYLALVFHPDRAAAVTAPRSLAFGRALIEKFHIDWAAVGYTEDLLDELSELMLRTLQSFLVDPGTPARNGRQLRDYLLRWIAPAVREIGIDGATQLNR